MKNIFISSINIQNFKGIKEFGSEFGPMTSIYGRNATGKTTVMDAIMWLLFGKDSSGRSDFQIRPVDANGAMVDNVDIVVSACLLTDGESPERIELEKVQKQKWVKKHGSTAPTFQGNTNEFRINGYPASLKEFSAKIAELVDEKLFRLLTDPRAFASLGWQEQREMLMGIAQDVSDEYVLGLDPETFEPVRKDVLEAGAEKAREKAAYTLKALKKEQEAYPIRIDEVSKGITETAPEEELNSRLSQLERELEDINKTRKEDSKTSEIDEIQRHIRTVDIEMESLDRQANEELTRKKADAIRRRDEISKCLMEARLNISREERKADGLRYDLDGMKADIKAMEKKWREARSRVLPDGETVCPTCGRPFDAKKVEEIKASFDRKREKDMNDADRRGRELRNSIITAQEQLERLSGAISAAQNGLIEIQAEYDAADAEYKALPAYATAQGTEKYEALSKEKNKLLKRAEVLLQQSENDRENEPNELETELRQAVVRVRAELAAVEANKRAQARMEELREEQLECSQKVADQEHVLFALDEFIKLKMSTLSGKINERFAHVRFRLFDQQINGAVKPTCVMQIESNGSYVDYPNANHAAQITGGVDVINTLSELYGVSAPVFIDNAECLNDENIPKTNGQLILLEVSDDKKLVVQSLKAR